MMLINDIFDMRPMMNTEDGKIRLENCSTNLETHDNINGYNISKYVTCRIAFDIYGKTDDNKYGKVFVESIDVDKYINIFLNLYKFDANIAKGVILILEKSIKSKLIYASADSINKEYHKLLEGLDYVYQKDYIYPDIKLYFKEAK